MLGPIIESALIAGLPLGVWYAFSFLALWMERLSFAPGFALSRVPPDETYLQQ